MRTNAAELSRLLQAFMNGGKLHEGPTVLQSRTIAQILSDQHVRFAPTERTHVQGLAWHTYTGLGAGVVWGHTGSDRGISTFILFRPQDRRGAAILMNGGGSVPIMAAEIALRVLAE